MAVSACVSEAELFRLFVEQLHRVNPDFLCGYEVQRGGLGYLIARADHAHASGLWAEQAEKSGQPPWVWPKGASLRTEMSRLPRERQGAEGAARTNEGRCFFVCERIWPFFVSRYTILLLILILE